MQRHLKGARLTLEQVVRLAAARPLPVARLGMEWLRSRVPKDDVESQLLLTLTEAQCDPLRGQIIALVSERLLATARFQPGWVLECLDSRHAEVRNHGMTWFRSEPRARDDVTLWRRLAESPFDDVRIFLIAELETRVAGRDLDRIASLGLDVETVRLLWASVLLNVHRGSRAKPAVIRQIVARCEAGQRNPACCCRFWPWLCGRPAAPSAGPAWQPWPSSSTGRCKPLRN